MKIVIALLGIAPWILMACSSYSSGERFSMSADQDLVIIVVDETGGVVEHARVLAVTQDGVTEIGEKKDLLRARIPHELLLEGGGALLICAEGYYCAGWMAGDPAIAAENGEDVVLLSITLAAIRLWLGSSTP